MPQNRCNYLWSKGRMHIDYGKRKGTVTRRSGNTLWVPRAPQLLFKAQICIGHAKHRLWQTRMKGKTLNAGTASDALQGCCPHPQTPGSCSSLTSRPCTDSAAEGPGIPTRPERNQRPHHWKSTGPEIIKMIRVLVSPKRVRTGADAGSWNCSVRCFLYHTNILQHLTLLSLGTTQHLLSQCKHSIVMTFNVSVSE